jgi:hypothetical protein
MSDKQEVTLGPFLKGIVSGELLDLDDPNAALDIVNYDIGTDGSLLSRRPLVSIPSPGARNNPIGNFIAANGAIYIIYNTSDGVKAVAANGATSLITTSNSHVALQYNDKLWVVCYNGASGSWNPSGAFVAVSGMPLGVSAVIKNDRLLIAGVTTEARVTYSNTGNFTEWEGAGGGYFTVRKQDGGYLQKLAHFNDQVYIFKTRGIWSLSFSANPGTGSLRLVSPTIGTQNPFCVVSHPEFLMFLFSGQIMMLNNNSIEVVSTKIADSLGGLSAGTSLVTGRADTKSDPAVPYDVDNYGHFIDSVRILFKVDEKFWVYNQKVDAWSRYDFGITNVPGHGMLVPNFADSSLFILVCGGLALSDFNTYTYIGRDATSSLYPDLIPFDTYVTTKSLEFGAKTRFKRLFWWSVDIRAKGAIIGSIAPITVKQPATWAQLASVKWVDMQTWANPLGALQGRYDDAYTSNYDQRSVIKFPRASRLRRMYFQVFAARGETPIKLYTISATVKASETVAAKES